MIRHCHRCGCEIEQHKDQKVIEFSGGERPEFRILCPTCYEIALAFCTPAYIPGISKTQYELLVYKQEQVDEERSLFERFKDEIRTLRNNGLTVPEIAQGTGASNRIIMEVLKC